MIIRCQNCGYKNQQVSIFCRKCGARLAKEQYDRAFTRKAKKKIILRVLNVLKFVVIFAVIALLCYTALLVFSPSLRQAKKIALSQKQFSEAIVKLHSFELQIHPNYTFSPLEVNALYNRYFIPRNLRRIPLAITINPNNTITFSIKKRLEQTIPVKCSITGTPAFSYSKSGRLLSKFIIKKIEVGSLLIPEVIGDYVVQQFKPYYTRRIRSILKKIDRFEVDKTKGFTVYLKKNNSR